MKQLYKEIINEYKKKEKKATDNTTNQRDVAAKETAIRKACKKQIKTKVTTNDVGNTYCPTCGNEVIERIFFTDAVGTRKIIMTENCHTCGQNISFSKED